VRDDPDCPDVFDDVHVNDAAEKSPEGCGFAYAALLGIR
jgi:hypothetical protein